MTCLCLTIIHAFVLRHSKSTTQHINILVSHRRFSFVLHNGRHLPVYLSVSTFICLLFIQIRQISARPREKDRRRRLVPFRQRKMILHNDLTLQGPYFRRRAIVLIGTIRLSGPLRINNVIPSNNVPNAFRALHPTLMIIDHRFRTVHVPLILLRRTKVVLMKVARHDVTTGFFVQFIIDMRPMFTTALCPYHDHLSARVIVLFLYRSTLSIKAFRCALYRHRQDQGAMLTRLCRNGVHVPFYVFLVLTRCCV